MQSKQKEKWLANKIILFAIMGSVLMFAAVAPLTAQTTDPFSDIPVTGVLPGGGTFQGTLDIVNFTSQNNRAIAQGILNGQLLNSAGTVINTITGQSVEIPVSVAQATCDILNLNLGPLNLNLLGLNISLNEVILDITADPAGGLLGSLLCGIAGLLNFGSILGVVEQLVGFLNTLLTFL